MWSISTIVNNTNPVQSIAFSDGLPLNAVRGGAGNCFRLMVNAFGFLDITDMGNQPSGPHYWQLVINGNIYWYDGQGSINLTINVDGSYYINGDGNSFSGTLIPLPLIADADMVNFDWLLQNNYVPYQNIPDEPGKTTAQIQALGLQYFPFTAYSFQLAMAVYDWTTADFTRIQFMKVFVYMNASGEPLDSTTIANEIWASNWGTYNPSNADYMNSYMMQPAASLEDVQVQLANVSNTLRLNNYAEAEIISAALSAMPRTSYIAVPALYSGQVDISQLGTEHFASYFLECPVNSDPSVPLQMPLADALATFITAGQPLTLKGFMSFTNSQQDALHYSNGILVIVNPPQNTSVYWENATYITPLSDGPEKIEYLFHPGSSFMVVSTGQITVEGKVITEVYLNAI